MAANFPNSPTPGDIFTSNGTSWEWDGTVWKIPNINELANAGVVIRTGPGGLTTRTITAGTGISISDGDGVSGNPTISATGGTGTVTSVASGTGLTGGPITTTGTLELTGQALALHNLATNGLIARTGAGTVAGRTITAGTGITVTNGDGVSGNPTISASNLGKILQVVSGTSTNTSIVTSTSYVDTNLSASITPSSASNKVLIICMELAGVLKGSGAGVGNGYVAVTTSGNTLLTENLLRLESSIVSDSVQFDTTVTMVALHSPSTTSSVTYKTRARVLNAGQIIINAFSGASAKTRVMILCEVAP